MGLLGELAPVLAAGATAPTAVLDAVHRRRGVPGSLARALEGFFVDARLTLPLDRAGSAAAARRERRVAEVPEPFHRGGRLRGRPARGA